jgi:hypothetical protein
LQFAALMAILSFTLSLSYFNSFPWFYLKVIRVPCRDFLLFENIKFLLKDKDNIGNLTYITKQTHWVYFILFYFIFWTLWLHGDVYVFCGQILQAIWLINKCLLIYMDPMIYCIWNARKKTARSCFLQTKIKESCSTVQWTVDACLHCSLNIFFEKLVQLIDFTCSVHVKVNNNFFFFQKLV